MPVSLERWATFDVYGTLIDWMSGIRGELARIWPEEDADRLLERYHELEPRIEEGRAIPYREVLSETLALVAPEEGLDLPSDEEDALGDSLPSWHSFPEVPGALAELRGRGFRLVPLSNTDPEFLAASLERIGVPFDGQVTAADAGSYKPAPGTGSASSNGSTPTVSTTSTWRRASFTTSRRPSDSASRPSGSTASARRATSRARPS